MNKSINIVIAIVCGFGAIIASFVGNISSMCYALIACFLSMELLKN